MKIRISDIVCDRKIRTRATVVQQKTGRPVQFELLQSAPGMKYKAALGVAYGAGLRVSEVAHLKVDETKFSEATSIARAC